MTTQTEALNIAIDYMNERLEDHDAKYKRHPATEAERINIIVDIETVKEALAQPEQEPVAWMNPYGGVSLRLFTGLEKNSYTIPLYTTPPQRTWVGLTESDRRLINFQWQDGNGTATEIIDLVESKLEEKNK